jgi:CBS domain-containing membrane protein
MSVPAGPTSARPGASPKELVVLFFGSFSALAVLGALSLATGTMLLFPPLGATAFLMFTSPRAAAASPRNTLFGYVLGLGAGYLSLACTGLLASPSVLAGGVDGARVIAAALSVALTSVAMVRLRCVHPPAGATTLVVSLGLVTKAPLVAMLMAGAALLALFALATHRALGTPYPLWAAPEGG